VLFKTGLSASTLPHMEHDVATTPGQRKVWQEKMREREADLKARGYCHDALSVLQNGGTRSHQPLYVGERQTELSPVPEYALLGDIPHA
jgi:hypothetical protein